MVAETMEFHPWNEENFDKENTKEDREQSVNNTLCSISISTSECIQTEKEVCVGVLYNNCVADSRGFGIK